MPRNAWLDQEIDAALERLGVADSGEQDEKAERFAKKVADAVRARGGEPIVALDEVLDERDARRAKKRARKAAAAEERSATFAALATSTRSLPREPRERPQPPPEPVSSSDPASKPKKRRRQLGSIGYHLSGGTFLPIRDDDD